MPNQINSNAVPLLYHFMRYMKDMKGTGSELGLGIEAP